MSRTLTTEISLDTIRPIIDQHDATEQSAENPTQQRDAVELSKTRAASIIITLTGTTLMSSFSNGLMTVGLPRMAKDVNLPANLLLWPASVYPLTLGCLLILAGSIADVVGSRTVFLIGCFLQGIFVLACGLATTGIQLIIFRLLQGFAVSMCLPTAVSIITTAFPHGRLRNLGLAFMGAGQPFGFCVGLVLGGLFVDSIGWRAGYYMCAAANIAFGCISYWSVPKDKPNAGNLLARLRDELDWTGAAIISVSLGLLSYVLATVSASPHNLKSPANLFLLLLSIILVPVFIFWMTRQEKIGRPALIPNSIWKSTAFSSICVTLLLSWSVLNVMEYFSSLFFQEVQHLSALQTALRFLPAIASGAALNIWTGFYAHKFRADYLVATTTMVSAAAPLLMALINPSESYWYSAFWAMLLGPLSADVLFTVAALVVTSAFPDRTQALGGAVFQTVAQFGTSLGLAIMASISSSVTEQSEVKGEKGLMVGYRVTFWVSFGGVLVAVVVGGVGLRGAGRVGLKRE